MSLLVVPVPGVSPAARTRPSPKKWVALMMDDLLHNYDVVIVIDGNDDNRHGPVGLGKSDIARWLGTIFDPEFSVERNLVVRDDYVSFRAKVNDRVPYKVILVDEAEWFFFNQWWRRKEVAWLTPEFSSNRKEGRIWILVLPLVWDMVPFMRQTRVQWRLRVDSRGEARLFVRSARRFLDDDEDRWGRYVATFTGIARLPGDVRDDYDDAIGRHRCLPKRCVGLLGK